MRQLELSDAVKELKTEAPKLNTSAISTENQYELAAIFGDASSDSLFITTSLLILHDRNAEEIMNLSKSGRNTITRTTPAKKIDPKKLLIMRNVIEIYIENIGMCVVCIC